MLLLSNKRISSPVWVAFLLCLGCGQSRENNSILTDIDGNTYRTVTIGKQVWMAENLKVTRYRNGDPVEHVMDSTRWSHLNTGAYCYYRNDTSLVKDYGLLYNWHALQDARGLAPTGWRIPSPEDMQMLMEYLQGDTIASARLKESGLTHWHYPNAGATNESGFTALPGGYRLGDTGSFHTLGSNGYWWTTRFSYEMYNWSPRLFAGYADVQRMAGNARYGLAIRCIREE